MKIIVIDNYDSFTYNLVHYLEDLDCDVTVRRNDNLSLEFIEKFDGLVEPYLNTEKSDELKNFMLKLDNANSIDSLFELSN